MLNATNEKRPWQAPMGPVLAGLVVVLGFTGTWRDPLGVLKYGMLALVPAMIVYGLSRTISGADVQPRQQYVRQFGYGATIALAGALALSMAVQPFGLPGHVVAGFAEEAVKIAVATYLAYQYRRLDSAVDGIAAAIAVSGGFAFTENILYFSMSHEAGVLGATFMGRGFLTPMAHPLFTAIAMAAIGYAVQQHRRGLETGVAVTTAAAGYLVAATGHTLFDFTAGIGAAGPLALTFVGMGALLAGVIAGRHHRLGRLRTLLHTRPDLFNRSDVVVLCDMRARDQRRDHLPGRLRHVFDAWASTHVRVTDLLPTTPTNGQAPDTSLNAALEELARHVMPLRFAWDPAARELYEAERERRRIERALFDGITVEHLSSLDDVLHKQSSSDASRAEYLSGEPDRSTPAASGGGADEADMAVGSDHVADRVDGEADPYGTGERR